MSSTSHIDITQRGESQQDLRKQHDCSSPYRTIDGTIRHGNRSAPLKASYCISSPVITFALLQVLTSGAIASSMVPSSTGSIFSSGQTNDGVASAGTRADFHANREPLNLLQGDSEQVGPVLQTIMAGLQRDIDDAPVSAGKGRRKSSRDDTDASSGDPVELMSESSPNDSSTNQAPADNERRKFAIELLKMLHEQYGSTASKKGSPKGDKLIEDRQSSGSLGGMMSQLLEAIGSNGDVRRLIDWVRNSFSPALMNELTTHFVVSKLGSVNCPALLIPDREETLIPRFLLFNEHFVDVPFELGLTPAESECLANAKFDPTRRTILLIHGFLAGYTLVDGITNIKNRLLDLNSFTKERALEAFVRASQNNGSYVLTEDLQLKVRQQLYNVIIVDWFNGANPIPRANYIRAATNSQIVGRLIARFLTALIEQCKTPAENLQIIAHSLGCHVSGFAGKALSAAGHRLGKITHLDPVGLCFGRLFSQPQFRLKPNDALETQAVHVSLNIFDNPLDGAQQNFLVNGGRDQIGCGGGPTEVKNSTSSSVSLIFDAAARFSPCSHIRALALFEENFSTEPAQCQMVGYRCPNYNRFLAGKCGFCDSQNSQCRLMSLPPVNLQFKRLMFDGNADDLIARASGAPAEPLVSYELGGPQHHYRLMARSGVGDTSNNSREQPYYYSMISDENKLKHEIQTPSGSSMFVNELTKRLDRRLDQQSKRLTQVIDKLRQDTRAAIAEGWTNLRGLRNEPPINKHISWTPDTVMDSETTLQTSSSGPHGIQMTKITTQPSDGGPDPRRREPSSGSTTPLTIRTTSAPSKHQQTHQNPALPQILHDLSATPSDRLHEEPLDQVPLGGQAIPRDSVNSPLFFLGTGSLSPYCVNYYQFRALIAESRIRRIMSNQALAPNRMALPMIQHTVTGSLANMRQRLEQAGLRDMLHLTVKLSDTSGHFFKGFSMLENSRAAARVFNEPNLSDGPAFGSPSTGANEPMLELTMLLNTTRAEPIKIGETIISYYFHPIVLVDRVEVNYMSNISPEVRARYSSVLCPVAINDRHQLVRYVECHKIAK